ncbi:MAG TPA: phenylalanine--tRNA ligase subunit beta [Victivallales bacterium]|nr:phenylalanine--tRNA ligase subunit beta [Victivallales bacterium]
MKISLNWLKEYVSISSDCEDLASKLTMAGIEVEGIAKFAVPDGIVVAEIRERNPHPNADKLSVCRVWDGSSEYQVVCGASNCDAGKKVPLAKLGTVFKDKKTGSELKIVRREIRKVPSEGMLCSAQELGLEEKSEGLLELPQNLTLGERLSEIYPSDVVFDLEITPNRPDLLSHVGIARDIAALCDLEVKIPKLAKFAKAAAAASKDLVTVLAPDLCPLYTARIVKGVNVCESPEWLKNRLRSIGLRPINNIVDITNFILFETGQPLHAFDLSLLKGGKIVVRRAKKGEKIKTLDEVVHELKEDNLVICDCESPVALAGIMGGEHSGIGASTKDILIESAYFDPSNIRYSSRNLAISSDSSHRFERGVDFEGVAWASDRALSLILELAGGELASELVQVCSKKPEAVRIDCRYEKIISLLGMRISPEEIVSIFKRLGCSVQTAGNDKCAVVPPSYRRDILCEADLAEEVLRIHGISQLPLLPTRAVCGGIIEDDAYLAIENFRNNAVSLGLFECLNYSFFDKASALVDQRFNVNTIAPISNPLSKDSEYMRPSLLAGMLSSVNRNISRGSADLSLFEIGNVFSKADGTIKESLEFCVVISGRKHPERFSGEKSVVFDFFDIKGLVESIFEINKLGVFEFEKISDDDSASKIFSLDRLAVKIGGGRVGIFGEAASSLVRDMRIKFPIYFGIFDLSAILALSVPKLKFKAFSQYPSTRRDIALETDIALENATIAKFIEKQKTPFLESFELFDVFSDEKLGKGRKSVAYSFNYRSMDKTLTDDEVNKIHDQLRAKIAKDLPVQLR